MEAKARKPKRRHTSKVMLLVSFTLHSTIVLGLAYFAAREGLLGKQLKKIAVEMVKEKPPDKPKEPEQPKDEPPKIEAPRLATAPRTEAPKAPLEAPKAVAAVAAPPVVAPPSVEVPSFVF